MKQKDLPILTVIGYVVPVHGPAFASRSKKVISHNKCIINLTSGKTDSNVSCIKGRKAALKGDIMILDWIEDPALSGSVVRFYNNKTFITAFYNTFDPCRFGFGRYLKTLLLSQWNSTCCFEDFIADLMFEINGTKGDYTAFEAEEDLPGEFEFEVTLMDFDLYITVKNNLSIIFYGKVEKMPVEV